MNKSFGEFFQPFLNTAELPEAVAKGEITALQVDSASRSITATVLFPVLVDRADLYEAEKRVAGAPALQLQHARLRPKFPPDSFSADYLPSLVREMKRRDASINGTFSDATARLEDGKIVVTLAHGGADLMRQRHVDRLMSRVISEEFGLSVAVDFDGVTKVDGESAAYLERQRSTEEKLRRQAAQDEMAQYESMMNRPSPHERKAAARAQSSRRSASARAVRWRRGENACRPSSPCAAAPRSGPPSCRRR